jgi:predicted RND superfamily exporter protein
MMVGENYSRMIVYLDMPEDDEKTFAFIDEMKLIASSYYDGATVYAVGNATTAKDFKESFVVDNVVVSAVSIITVLLVLLLSFKSVAMPVILIAVIQGAIWISFSIPSLLNTPLFFLGYIIISAIQMGANIDYAIVIATRYNEVKGKMNKRDAIIETMNFAFPTVITSGSIMAVTGILIGNMSSEQTIASLGGNLGRGTVISIILVLFVLPQLLLISDKWVDKTSFTLFKKKEKKTAELDGRVRVCGRVSGEFSGTIEGVIDAVIDGNVNLKLLSGAEANVAELVEAETIKTESIDEEKEADCCEE